MNIDNKQMNKAKVSFWHLLERLLYAAFAVTGVIFAYGYRAPRPNHTFELPPIMALLDSSLYGGDYFIQEMLLFTPRTYYNYLIYILGNLGLDIPLTLLVLFVLTLASYILGLQAISRNFGHARFSAALLSFWGLTVVAGDIGGNGLFRFAMHPGILAMGFAIWGVYFCLRRMWAVAYLLFGVACLFQFLVGLLPVLMVTPLVILETWRTREWFRAILALILFSIGAGLVYIPMVILGTTGTDLLSNREFIELYGFIRHSHHIVPSSWRQEEWIQLFLFYAGGLLCIYRSRSLSPTYRLGLSLVVVLMFMGLLANYIFVEVVPLSVIAKLQLARMTPFAELAILIGLTCLFDEHLKQRNWLVCFAIAVIPVSSYPGILLLLLGISLGPLASISSRLRSGLIPWILAIITSGMAFIPISSPKLYTTNLIVFGFLLFPYVLTQFAWRSPDRSELSFSSAWVSIGITLAAICIFLPNRIQSDFPKKISIERVPYHQRELVDVATQFRQASENEALVLVPPSDLFFNMFSQRSIVVSFKNFPYTDSGIVEWKDRIETVLNVPIQEVRPWKIEELYRSRSSSALLEVSRHYGAGYILSQHDWHPDMPGEEIASSGPWRVWKIEEALSIDKNGIVN